jgi:predicted small lipoprotein YifL
MRRSLARLTGLVMTGLVVAVLSVSLAGCGKRGNPKPPENKPVTYPKTYPTK